MIPGWKVAYQDFVSVVLLPAYITKQYTAFPNYKDPVYLKEDFSKKIDIASHSR
jgi:hypothetical protein